MGGETRPLYYPGGWQQRTTSIPDYPLVGVTLQDGRPRPGKSPHSAALQPGPAERGRDRRPGAVLAASRWDRGTTLEGVPKGWVAASRAGSIRTVWSCLKRRPPFLFLPPPPAAPGRGGRGNRWDTSECFAPPIRARGPNLLAEVLYTVYCILCAKPGIPSRRFRQTSRSSFLSTSGSRGRRHHNGNSLRARGMLFCQDPQIATKQLRRSSNCLLQARCPCRNVACILTD